MFVHDPLGNNSVHPIPNENPYRFKISQKQKRKVEAAQFISTTTYDDVRRRTSTYDDVRRRTTAYDDVRRRTSAYVDVRQRTSPYVEVCRRRLTDIDVRRLSTYANVWNVDER